ncbi:MAG: hypothetical protein FJ087_03570 [Deltaproteobacteria bacterium]|nr:hypothetical protein [Deltaproteobacteria bacterium]
MELLLAWVAATAIGCGGGTTPNPGIDTAGGDPGPDVADVPVEAAPEVGDSDARPGDDGTGPEVGPDTAADEAGEQGPEAVEELPKPCEEGAVCDDGDPCTHVDRCTGGVCAGAAYACDDGRDCTGNECDGYGGCRYPTKPGFCLVNNVCYEAGRAAPLNACAKCDPGVASDEFSAAPDGSACGADDPCLRTGECAGGQCSAAPADCDDENPCTDDSCVPLEGCRNVANFDGCEDGDPCTLGDQCRDGECVTGFLPLDCWDGNPCTADLCTPAGCENPAVAILCEDGDVCTEGDRCVEGACTAGDAVVCDDGNDCTTEACYAGMGCQYDIVDSPCCSKTGANVCDDKNPCTHDVCNPGGTPGVDLCRNTPWTGPCNDGNLCTGPDRCGEDGKCAGPERDCDDQNGCTADSCDPKKGCVYTVVGGACDDGSLCTTDDACLPNGVCSGKPVSCDDKNGCTKDSCAPATGCAHEATAGACNDGNACTSGDSCATGTCMGAPTDCNDGNPCTTDGCHPAAGCRHTQVAGPCDDGKSCTVNDQCTGGVCTGTQVGLCCTPDWSAPVNRVSSLALGESGHPGQGLDVDGKPGTCAPPDKCSAGIDNSLSSLSAVANPELKKAFDKGDINILFESRGFNTNGTAFMLAFWDGKPADAGCDVATQSCAYLVNPDMMDSQCKPMYGFANAKVVGDKLTAGGVGYGWPLDIPITDGVTLHVEVANTQIQANVTLSGGKPVAMTNGLLAGAVPKAAMIEAIKAIPDDQLPPPLTKDTIIGLMDLLVVNDIDTDGDKNLDAASVGIRFSAIGGSIAGLKD